MTCRGNLGTLLFRRRDYCLRLHRRQRHLPDGKVGLRRGLRGGRRGVVQVDRGREGVVLRRTGRYGRRGADGWLDVHFLAF